MKKRTFRKIRAISFVLLLLLTITFAYNKFTTKEDYVTREQIYTVVPNDTLWNIAKDFNYNNQDIREVIYEIKRYNEIGSNIYPGQVILIPIKVSADEYEKYEQLLAMMNN